MVDFAKETLLDVREAAIHCKVCTLTVRRWFKQGLDHAKLGGKVFTTAEALNRFSRQGNVEVTPAIVIDREARAVLRELRDRFGIKLGPEADTDGRQKQACA